jgi:hypothetical protein
MNALTTISSNDSICDSVPPHCQHRTPSGRRCRMAVFDRNSSLCPRHAALQQQLQDADFASVLIGDTGEFRDAVSINRSLGELYKLLARNQISPRRGAVMAYTANLLLRTLPEIERERSLSVDATDLRVELGDLPRPDRS